MRTPRIHTPAMRGLTAMLLAAAIGAGVPATATAITPTDAIGLAADTTTEPAATAAATATPFRQVGTIRLTGLKDSNGKTVTDLGAMVDAYMYEFAGSLDMGKVKEGDRLAVDLKISSTNGRYSGTPWFQGVSALKDSNGNPLFTIAWNQDGHAFTLTRTSQPAAGTFTFTLRTAPSKMDANLGAHPEAGTATFTVDDSTVTLPYSKYTPFHTGNQACNADTSYARVFSNPGASSATLTAMRLDCTAAHKVLAGTDPTSITDPEYVQDSVVVIHVAKPDANTATLKPQLLLRWYLRYDDTHLSQMRVNDWTMDAPDMQDQRIVSISEARTRLQPGEVAAHMNDDGSMDIAANLGPEIGGRALNPTSAQLDAIGDTADRLMVGGLVDQQVGAPGTFLILFFKATDGDMPYRAAYTSTSSQGDKTITDKGVLKTNPGGMFGQGQSGIRFQANGGTGDMGDMVGDANKPATLPANAFTRTGYTFTGWNTKPDGSGDTVRDQATVTYPVDGIWTTLTAQWKANSYTIRYDAGDGQGSMKDTPATYDKDATLAGNAFTRAGYSFAGWRLPDGTVVNDKAAVRNLTADDGGVVTLTAQWTAGDANLTYDAGEGGNAPQAQPGKTGQQTTVSTQQPTRDGYTFAGWKTPDGRTVQPGDKLTLPAGGLKLTAQWEASPATLTYDGNGGTGAPQAQPGKTGQTLTVSESKPTRSGYSFAGWKTPDGRTVDAGDKLTLPAGGVKLTAVWEAHAYTIRFDAADGQGTMDDVAATYDKDVTLPANAFTRDGYTFQGWTTPDGTIVDDKATVRNLTTDADGTVTLTARWEGDPATLAYDANQGTGAPAPVDGKTGQSLTVSKTMPTRPGYTFTGWKTGSDAVYQPGDTIVLPAGGLTLTAQWTAGDARLSYDANHGQGAPAAQAGKTGQSLTVSKSKPIRSGYSFTGWQTPDGRTVQPGDQVTLPAGGMTLTAQWSADKATLAYDGNGGTGVPADVDGVTDQTIIVNSAVPSKNGYTFTGWKGSDGKTYQPGDTVTLPAGGVKLTAQWAAGDAALTYDANGGKDAPATQSGKTDDTVTVSKATPTRDGYTFTGWQTPDGKTVDAGDKLTLPAGGVKLTAQWEANPYTIRYAAGDGQGSMKDTPAVYDQDVTLQPNAFTRDGYSFTGWKTPDGTILADGATVRNLATDGTITLTAQWAAGDAALTYDGNGGKDAPAAQPGKTGDTVTIPDAKPTRDGWTFTSWKTPDGRTVQPGDQVTLPAGGLKLTAQWTADKATFTYDANQGAGAPAPVDGVTGQTVTVSPDKPTRDGYTFTGWQTPDGTTLQPGDTVTLPAGGLTLTAQWEAGDAPLSYDANGGTGAPQTQPGKTDQTLAVDKATPTRDGYEFAGWQTPDGNTVQPGDQVTLPAGGLRLTAQWKASATSLSYESGHDGATGTTPATPGVTDGQVTAAGNGFTLPGWTFTGWKLPDGTTVRPGDQVTLPAGGLTAVAQWTADKATLTYDGNGGQGAMPPVDSVTDATVQAADNAYTRDGYTFAGWQTPDGRTVQPGDQVTLPAGGLTLTAQWKAKPADLTYDPNGGTGDFEPIAGVTDGTVTIAKTTPERDGYTFTGWNMLDGKTVQPGGTVTLPAGGVKVTAQWKADPSAVTYQPNKGEGTMADTTGVTDQQVTLAANAFTRPGYTFTGWNTKADGTGTGYPDQSQVTLPAGGLTLTAQWTADKASIAYEANGGTGSMPAQDGVTDATAQAADNTFTRKGWTFTGWNTAADGTGDAIRPGDTVTFKATPTILHAQWKADPSDVTFDPNGGKADMPETGGVTDQTITLPGTTPVRDGWTFTGWKTPDGTTLQPGAQVTLPAGGMTLTAQWKANPAPVRFDPNGGHDAPADLDGNTGDTATLPKDTPVRDGWTFTGWQTPDGATLQPGAQATLPAGGLTLTAQWKANPTGGLASTGTTVTATALAALTALAAATAATLARHGRHTTGRHTR